MAPGSTTCAPTDPTRATAGDDDGDTCLGRTGASPWVPQRYMPLANNYFMLDERLQLPCPVCPDGCTRHPHHPSP